MKTTLVATIHGVVLIVLQCTKVEIYLTQVIVKSKCKKNLLLCSAKPVILLNSVRHMQWWECCCNCSNLLHSINAATSILQMRETAPKLLQDEPRSLVGHGEEELWLTPGGGHYHH